MKPCNCHHWVTGGEGRASRPLRMRCSNAGQVDRPSDGRLVCPWCVGCNPADSAGFPEYR